ncbi:MAG: Glu/Leu/Phe/Val dehydrogenase [Gemmatimonadales bacterium]|nr:MAG: Glu/Leu/Phe/Val dehydrogenase [Gemmatimonadales bacterium]
MDMFESIQTRNHEQVVFCYEPSCNYKGIIAIHDTTLGPALGGTRFWNYKSTDEALVDVLRLSRGMTYKAAVAGLSLGGGKAVIIGDNKRNDREALFRTHGRFVESLGGRYITAEDVGTSPADMDFVHFETNHVTGLQGLSGDPSPVTAYGVYVGIKAAAKKHWGSDSLAKRVVAIQGCGNVGRWLASYLHEEGTKLIVSDVDDSKVKRLVDATGATAVAPEAIYDQQADVFAPCALGAIVNDNTIPRFKVEIVAGGANNQLAEARHGSELEARNITYAPDYVINGGGLINVWGEINGWSSERSKKKAAEIYDAILKIFAIAEREGIPSNEAADRLAEERVLSVRAMSKMWLPRARR